MRIRTAAAVAVLAFGAILGSAGAVAADPDPVVTGVAASSPGVLSGNVIQVPIGVPINLCGTSVSVIGLLNPASATMCDTD